MSTTLRISETFTSLQGEGPSTGEPAYFLRLADCNLSCNWCDSKFTWDWTTFHKDAEVTLMSPDALVEHLASTFSRSVRLLVLTGGEPLIQHRAIAPPIARFLRSRPDVRVEVETNGTIAPHRDLLPIVHRFIVSPKLANSGQSIDKRIQIAALQAFARLSADLKFVIVGLEDISEALEIADRSGFERDRVWLMPEGTDDETVTQRLREIVPHAIVAGVHVSGRLHVGLWGDARGK